MAAEATEEANRAKAQASTKAKRAIRPGLKG